MFGLGTFSAANGGGAFPGLVVDGRVIDLRPELGATVTTADLLDSWDASLARLESLAGTARDDHPALGSLRPLPPIQPSRQIFCAGANYRTHIRQMVLTAYLNDPEEARPRAALEQAADDVAEQIAGAGKPFVFTLQASALCGAEDEVILWGPGSQHDWELELAVVIGRPAHNVAAADALAYVAGYTISNDITTRDLVFRSDVPMTDFLAAKGRPTFLPTGPYIVPRAFVPDYRELRMTLSINGEVMQDEVVGDDIVYGVEELVAHVSTITTLHPGDLLLTGSPAGNAGHHGNRWLRPGDTLEGEISSLGSQRNRCVGDPRDTAGGRS